jgi:hypothetical protein
MNAMVISTLIESRGAVFASEQTPRMVAPYNQRAGMSVRSKR